MPSDNAQAEKKLRKLSQYLQRGWQRQHPVRPKILESFREVARAQWEFDHQVPQKPQRSQDLEHSKEAEGHKRPPPTQRQDHGHSH
jgi:hypothetical protein